MSLFNNYLAAASIAAINLFFCSNLFAANIYVDKNLSSNCTANNYSTVTRNCSGSDGNAYNTIQLAVDNMSTSDDIYIRGGTYLENILLRGSSHPSGTIDDYASMQSYPGEWAIIDGQGIAQYTIGTNRAGREPGDDLAYWKFEKLEITGGAGSDGGAGLMISRGPFIIRYNYIHDNINASGANNPGGIVGYTWRDSIIEYNYFHNNGTATGTDGNSANIAIFSDYDHRYIGENGFTERLDVTKRNEVRYNYFSGSAVGFKHKSGQLLTGRNPASPATDYNDTYKEYGDKLHHNYFVGQRRVGLLIEQDFAQAYNNIFDNVAMGITVQYQPDYQMYKVVTYNNTLLNPGSVGITRFGCDYFSFTENESHFGWDYNNILDSTGKDADFWFLGVAMNIFACAGGTPYTNPDISNYINSNNYFYRSNDPDIFRYGTTFYTAAEFEVQTETGAPRVAYTNPYEAGNTLYAGTTGANKFITLGPHLIEGAITIANGGIGGSHPYLAAITLPSYVGAVDPSDSSWVSNILCLTDVEVLMNGGIDGPACSKRPKVIDIFDVTVIKK